MLGRHGDIEDTLLNLVMSRAAGGKKFDKMMVKRVYFGNWLRDYCMCQTLPLEALTDLFQPRQSMSVLSNTFPQKLFASYSGY